MIDETTFRALEARVALLELKQLEQQQRQAQQQLLLSDAEQRLKSVLEGIAIVLQELGTAVDALARGMGWQETDYLETDVYGDRLLSRIRCVAHYDSVRADLKHCTSQIITAVQATNQVTASVCLPFAPSLLVPPRTAQALAMLRDIRLDDVDRRTPHETRILDYVRQICNHLEVEPTTQVMQSLSSTALQALTVDLTELAAICDAAQQPDR